MSLQQMFRRVFAVEQVNADSSGTVAVAAPSSAHPTEGIVLGKFMSIAIQLGLLVLVIRQFQLVGDPFYDGVMQYTFFGFLLHHFLPLRYRLPFFALLSLTCILGVLGFTDSMWLFGLGFLLIGIAHLPLSFGKRIGLLMAVGAAFALLRLDWIQAPALRTVWPVLGSMFMFRFIIYLYDMKHQKESFNLWRTISYFFLLPNVAFPLFPVVDYSAFRRTYYNEERYRIYQRGIKWIYRGVIHLILYRAVVHYFVLTPEEVASISDFIRFIVANFLLYLQVSGTFHIIVGILLLFGFNLPETHHYWCLSHSFTDFWRRINIYWKDFMQKVFFYPIYFRLRKWGNTMALVITTAIVFIATWFLHTYQWFWLQGSFLLTLPDILFWVILGLLVIANVLFENKFGRKRTLGKRTRNFGYMVSLTLRTVATFLVICVLWSLWTSFSLSEWFSLLSAAGMEWGDLLKAVPLLFFAGVFLGGIFSNNSDGSAGTGSRGTNFFRSSLTTGLLIFLLYALSLFFPAITTNKNGDNPLQTLRQLKTGAVVGKGSVGEGDFRKILNSYPSVGKGIHREP